MPGLRNIPSRKERTVTDHLPTYLSISSTYFFNLPALISSSSPTTGTHRKLSLLSNHHQSTNPNTNNTAKMTELKAGDNFPEGVFFSYIPPTPEISKFSTCGTPVPYNASQGT